MIVDFLSETMEPRRKWHIFKAQRENSQPRIRHPVKISFRNSGEIKTFSDKVKPKECVASRPALEELLKEAFR